MALPLAPALRRRGAAAARPARLGHRRRHGLGRRLRQSPRRGLSEVRAMRQELEAQLAAAVARRDVTTFEPSLLDAAAPETAPALVTLLADQGVVVVDELAEQLEQLVRGRAPGEQLSGAALREAVDGVLGGREPARFGTWVFYPW